MRPDWTELARERYQLDSAPSGRDLQLFASWLERNSKGYSEAPKEEPSVVVSVMEQADLLKISDKLPSEYPWPGVNLEPLTRCEGIFPRGSGVYFLWKSEEIVYVGLSGNLGARLHTHIQAHKERLAGTYTGYETEKPFEFATWQFAPRDQIRYLEARYIHKLLPRYNRMLDIAALRATETR